MATLGELNVFIKLRGVSEFKQGIRQTKQDLDFMKEGITGLDVSFSDFTKGIKQFERTLRDVSIPLRNVGLAITGIFGVAIREAAKSNVGLQDSLEDIRESFGDVSRFVGDSVSPVIRKLADDVEKLAIAFKKIPPGILQAILVGGGAALGGGILGRFGGSLLRFGRGAVGGLGIAAAGFGASALERRRRRAAQFLESPVGQLQGFRGLQTNRVSPVEPGIRANLGELIVGGGGKGTSDIQNAFEGIGSGFEKIMDDLKKSSREAGTAIALTMKTSANEVAKGFGDAVAQSIVFGKNFEESFISSIKNIAAEMLSFLTQLITKMLIIRSLGFVGSIFGGDLVKGLGLGGSKQKGLLGLGGFLGFLQEGGIVQKPGLAFLHPNEAVVPLDEAGQLGGNVTVNFTEPVFFNDPSAMDQFIRKFTDNLKRISNRRTGGTSLAF